MATHPFRDLWRPSLVLVQNEQHKEMLPTLFQKETGNQRSTTTNVNHGSMIVRMMNVRFYVSFLCVMCDEV